MHDAVHATRIDAVAYLVSTTMKCSTDTRLANSRA
jgi:hypothetical protein